MKRRDVIGAGLALASAGVPPGGAAGVSAKAYARPGTPGWPSADDWAGLGRAVGGRLAPVAAPDLSGAHAGRLLANPFYIADQPALTESSGWLDAWRTQPSVFHRSSDDCEGGIHVRSLNRVMLN